MKVLNYLALFAAGVLSFGAITSCSDDNDKPEVAEVLSHIYLTVPDGTTTLTAGSDEEIVVAVTLSQARDKAASLEFVAEGAGAEYVVLEDNPVVIPAGSTVGSFTVKAAENVSPESSTSLTFNVKDIISTQFDLKDNVTITVMPGSGSANLTPEEKALIESWKTKYGVDLTPWIGTVSLSGTLVFPGDGVRDAFVAPTTVPLSGSSLFGISSKADDTTPVLDMLENPMGMADYLYKTFLQLTVGDKEYFALEEDGTGLELMELINWNDKSEETFAVTLPGLRITSIKDGKATVEFVAEGDNYILNSKGEPIYSAEYEMDLTYNWATSWIPFTYSYSAWSRQLALVENGDPTALELLTYGVSAAPATYLGVNDILEDVWEIDEDEDGVANLYVSPKGVIDFNAGTMTFEFPFDHADQYGYSRVNVVYTLK